MFDELRKIRSAWNQGTNSPFILPRWKSQSDSPSQKIHKIAADRFVRSPLGRLVQFVFAPIKLVRVHSRLRRELRGSLGYSKESGFGFFRSLYATLYYNIDPCIWYTNRLWRSDKIADILGYVSHHEICKLLPHLNRFECTRFLDNKVEFDQFCQLHELPRAPILGVFESGSIRWFGGLREFPKDDLFFKADDLYCGVGAQRWEWLDVEQRWERNGIRLTEDELMNYFEAQSDRQTFLVQSRLRNHEMIESFTNGSLATLRIVTVKKSGGVARIMASSLRMPVGGSEVDNFASGGLAAPVNPAGVIGAAISRNNPVEFIEKHPDTGCKFAGLELPMFHEALQICLRAHGNFERPHFVGWDVAFSSAGPILLEANVVWGVDIIQKVHQKPLSHFGFMEDYLDCLAQEESMHL